MTKGLLGSSAMDRVARLQLPYRPPAEYDYRIEFSPEQGHLEVFMILAAGGRQFMWCMSGGPGGKLGFAQINGAEFWGNASTVKVDSIFQNGKRYSAVVQVRKQGVRAFIDGKLVSEWKTDYSDMTLHADRQIRDERAIGIGTWESQVSFSKIDVVEISGPGEAIQEKAPTESGANRHPIPAPAAVPASSGTVTIDISVPAAEASATTEPAPPANPNAVERPEYRTRAKSLVRTLTSATSMMVRIGENGEALGFTSDIIATVDPESRQSNLAGIGIVRADGDETMKTALEEAVRAVKLRYPLWEPGHIDLSFGEKFVAHGGPSAGAAFGLLMLSTLEGFEIDPKCAVTGDITVDWKVREVGGVTAKVRGATLDKCLYAAIPVGNETAFADMALLYGKSSVWDIQVFSVATLQDAVALARRDRPAQLAEAIKLFAELQPQLTKAAEPTLKDPQTVQSLKHILDLAPNHLSAKYLLAMAEGTAAKTLSANGTMYQLSVIFYPYRAILQSRDGVDRHALPAATTMLARKRLAALRLIANKSLLPAIGDVSTLIDAMDNLAGGIGSVAAVNNRLDNLNARLVTLQSDLGFVEKYAREAY